MSVECRLDHPNVHLNKTNNLKTNNANKNSHHEAIFSHCDVCVSLCTLRPTPDTVWTFPMEMALMVKIFTCGDVNQCWLIEWEGKIHSVLNYAMCIDPAVPPTRDGTPLKIWNGPNEDNPQKFCWSSAQNSKVQMEWL